MENAVVDVNTLFWQSFHGKEPFFDRQWSRVVKHQGRIVSHVCWVPRQMRVGGVTIQAGMVGYVATHPDHRGKGLTARLMDTWAEELTRMGYQLSIVTGIPNLFERVAYSFAFHSDVRDPRFCSTWTILVSLGRSRIAAASKCRTYPCWSTYARSRTSPAPVLSCATTGIGGIGGEGLRLSNRLSREDIWLVKDGQERATGYVFLRHLPHGCYEIPEAAVSGNAAADDLLELATTQALSDVVRPFSQRLPISVER